MSLRYVVAASKLWIEGVEIRLSTKLGEKVALVTTPEELQTILELEKSIERIFFTHWSHIIPPEIHRTYDCVIFHMTDLPFGRGGTPLQNLISRGCNSTKVSALKCVDVVDAGPIYLKEEMSLEGSAKEIYARAQELSEAMILRLVSENPAPVAQAGAVTKFRRRKPEESEVDFHCTPQILFDQIRMVDAPGYPQAYLEVGSFKISFTDAVLEADAVFARVKIKAIDKREDTSGHP